MTLLADPPRGDFVEAIDLGRGRLGLAAGGVAGEEGEAQLVAALAQSLVRRHAGPDRCPSEVLKRVNADIYADLDGRSFVAVTYALIDLASYRIRLARAGLSAPVLVSSGRTPRLRPLDAEGMVMGIDKGPIFEGALEVRALELEPGDLVALFTNGVLEARGANRDEFGLARMHGLLERYGTHEAEYLTDKFREHFELHLGERMRRTTDACLLALRRGGRA